MVWIVMGVSGSGKTTVGELLAERFNLPFYDADDFHPPSNVEKMSSGQPLNDEDRKPWLLTLTNHIRDWNNKNGAVLACSALKQNYRDLLKSKSPDVYFIYLQGSKRLILERMKNRNNHYMPTELLDSQFDALEEPAKAIVVPIDQDPEEIVNQILKSMREID